MEREAKKLYYFHDAMEFLLRHTNQVIMDQLQRIADVENNVIDEDCAYCLWLGIMFIIVKRTVKFAFIAQS